MLAQTGATLILASRDAGKLQVVADEEIAKGNRVFTESLDQGDEASVWALKERIPESPGFDRSPFDCVSSILAGPTRR